MKQNCSGRAGRNGKPKAGKDKPRTWRDVGDTSAQTAEEEPLPYLSRCWATEGCALRWPPYISQEAQRMMSWCMRYCTRSMRTARGPYRSDSRSSRLSDSPAAAALQEKLVRRRAGWLLRGDAPGDRSNTLLGVNPHPLAAAAAQGQLAWPAAPDAPTHICSATSEGARDLCLGKQLLAKNLSTHGLIPSPPVAPLLVPGSGHGSWYRRLGTGTARCRSSELGPSAGTLGVSTARPRSCSSETPLKCSHSSLATCPSRKH